MGACMPLDAPFDIARCVEPSLWKTLPASARRRTPWLTFPAQCRARLGPQVRSATTDGRAMVVCRQGRLNKAELLNTGEVLVRPVLLSSVASKRNEAWPVRLAVLGRQQSSTLSIHWPGGSVTRPR